MCDTTRELEAGDEKRHKNQEPRTKNQEQEQEQGEGGECAIARKYSGINYKLKAPVRDERQQHKAETGRQGHGKLNSPTK